MFASMGDTATEDDQIWPFCCIDSKNKLGKNVAVQVFVELIWALQQYSSVG